LSLPGDELLERAPSTVLQETVEAFFVFDVPVVVHDIGVLVLHEGFHDFELSFVAGGLVEHLTGHELDSDDLVLAEVVALVDFSEVTLAELFILVDVEIFADFLKTLLHCF
jgi:hypothetical protein